MRIGVLANIQHSMFSSGLANASVAIAELMIKLGHTVDIINIRDDTKWWDDCTTISLPVVKKSEATHYDVVFEIDRMTLTKEERQRIATHSIWVLRHPFLIGEIESTLFPVSPTIKRELEGLTETWVYDAAAAAEPTAIQSIELLTNKPVRIVPYLWSPSIVKAHMAEQGMVSWLENTIQYLRDILSKSVGGGDSPVPKWTVRVAEKNVNNMSSATVPLVILREVKRRGNPIETCKVYNTEILRKSKFFNENIVNNSLDAEVGLSGEFIGRQRSVDWVREPMACVLSHLRFSYIRPMLLDTVWAGIPTLHNSSLIRDIGEGLERLFYSNNSIGEACAAFERMHEDFLTLKGFFSPESVKRIQVIVAERYTPSSQNVQCVWGSTLENLLEKRSMTPVMSPVRTLRVGFCDMWENFNPEYNFFTLMLSSAAAAMTPPIHVVGGAATSAADIIIFGPFGSQWRTLPAEQPKVHFTGENTQPVFGPGVGLNLGYLHMDMVPEEYLRFPLWILEIDWFGAEDRIANPKPIPLELCTTVRAAEIARKKKFCSFIVTNPRNPVRNAAFLWLSEYKHVDSAGAYMNNVGSQIFAGQGGGGGERKKVEFLKDYKFSITYENASSRGYTTEKYLHAKAAGCIPIYWGDSAVERDFNMAGAIDARNVRSKEELIELVRKVDEDDSEWLKRYSVPALDAHRVAWCKRTMAELSKRVFKLAGLETGTLPTMLEPLTAPFSKPMATKTEVVAEMVAEIVPELPLMVTCVSRTFLSSLQQWLTSIASHKNSFKDLKVIVYFFSDVPADTVSTLKEKFSFATFTPLPDSAAPIGAFSDFWDPKHYGWKLWILNELAIDTSLTGKMVLYMDAGTFLCRWPKEMMIRGQTHGACFLEDPREDNSRWCSKEFCNAMGCTAVELSAQQVQAATICFRAGSPMALSIFPEALRRAYTRDILVGPKWLGTGSDGKPFGHRHDQSILSILSMRSGAPRICVDTVQCGTSLRKTFITGRSVYIHRGRFAVHHPAFPMIDDAYVINLERRKDRMERLWSSSPELKGVVERWPAVEGKELELTPLLARLLKPNDFFWKKAVTGCALSHLGLWRKLANETADITNYLILEDDVQFQPHWQKAWASAVEDGDVPTDYDIIYLGGVLPPNREGFEGQCREKVNNSFSRIKENMTWGQASPSRYFHFCAYAYILTKTGAQKVMKLINDHDGIWTSADHILCNPVDTLKSYVFDPLIAGCYQDSDPVYANSQFNDFSRVDSFDSDLWNNNERFSEDDIRACMTTEPLNIKGAMENIRTKAAITEDKSSSSTVIVDSPPSRALTNTSPVVEPRALPRRFICLDEHALEMRQLYECDWLLEYFGNPTSFTIDRVKVTDPPPTDCPILFVSKPYIQTITNMLERWDSFGAEFYVIHVSDEGLNDPVNFYSLNSCKKVLRFYKRPDLPCPEKVTTIPLGYHHTRADTKQDPFVKTPKLPFRETLWSFVGTSWRGRKELLEPLMIHPNKAIFLDTWNGPDCMPKDSYVQLLLDTVFVPCPSGNNPETFRFYEALDCGCVPIVVLTDENREWLEFVFEHIPLLPLRSWDEAAKFIEGVWGKEGSDREILETYRAKLISAWMTWKRELAEEGLAWLV